MHGLFTVFIQSFLTNADIKRNIEWWLDVIVIKNNLDYRVKKK